MKRFVTTPTVKVNQYNQKTITGKITLSKNYQLVNEANNGVSPLDTFNYNVKDSVINLGAGEIVNLEIQEMAIGKSFTISFTNTDGIKFSKTITK